MLFYKRKIISVDNKSSFILTLQYQISLLGNKVGIEVVNV